MGYYGYAWAKVSVPYRGATFLNLGSIFPPTRVCCCFRPLSGSYISQLCSEFIRRVRQESFRPLSGSYISQFRQSDLSGSGSQVSVPYRGATFLNLLEYQLNAADVRFRPLSGSYISQLVMGSVGSRNDFVSVPYRGATFLNNHTIPPIMRGDDGFRPLSGSYISQFS